MSWTAIDPTDGSTIDRYPELSPDEASELLGAVDQAAGRWAEASFDRRAEVLRSAAAILRDRAGSWAELMTREMGKPLTEAASEAEKCAWACDYYADNGEAFLAPERVSTDALRSYWTHRPLGVVLGIMPWNFPFWQVFRFSAPALMAGNAAILKHAENVPGCALAIEEIWSEAGLPEDVFRTAIVDLDTTADLIDDPRVRAVSVTGSVEAGRAVASRAGRRIKPTVLELGGSDPYVVLEDADLDRAADTCVTSRLLNSGQSCIAAKRWIAVDAIHDAFLERVRERLVARVVGDPMDESTDVGPMAREDLRDDLHDQVRRTVDAGATLVMGGEVPDRPGWWYPVTLLADVPPGSAARTEELFGPVASVIRARDEDDAIRIANDTRYGLGAAVFTADVERGERIAADRLEAGACFVNAFVKSDPRLPFGGIKESGYGRELSPLGIREFVNRKTVWVEE